MKMKFIFFVGVLLCLCFSACASGPAKRNQEKTFCEKWLMPDSVAYNKLGKRLATILFSPQAVRCYHLIGKEKVEDEDLEVEPHFVRDTLLATLKSNEIAVLQYSLLKPAKSYENDSIRVMSPYMPILEFEFVAKKDKAHVVVSLSDMSWTVIYDEKRQFNYTYANEELVSMFCKYYVSLYKESTK